MIRNDVGMMMNSAVAMTPRMLMSASASCSSSCAAKAAGANGGGGRGGERGRGDALRSLHGGGLGGRAGGNHGSLCV
jgi:hypothetical protein